MNCKEHILHFFLQGQISLSQYDYKFMSNLQMMIHNDNRVTSNQATLFDKLISKYAKQLKKIGVTPESLTVLPWNATFVESTPEFTGATVSIIDDEIVIRVPFNKSFIEYFKNVNHNTFVWIKEERRYRSPFSTLALKIAVQNLTPYFPTMHFCDNVLSILNELKQYQTVTVWDPTLVKVGDTYLIAACNEHLGNILDDIPLDLSSKSLLNMTRRGIKVDPSLIENDPKLVFAHSFIAEVDLDDLETFIGWLVELECKGVLISRGLGLNKSIRPEIEDALLKANIPFVPEHSAIRRGPAPIPTILIQMHRPDPLLPKAIMLGDSTQTIEKIVVLKNSRPIDIK